MWITEKAAIDDNVGVVCGHKQHGESPGKSCLLAKIECGVFAGDFIVQIMITFADFNCCHRKLHW